MKKHKCNYLNFCLKFNIFFILINPFILSECNFSYPIMKNNKCINTTCSKYEFNSGACVLENDIIRDQAFTSNMKFTDSNPDYIALCSTPNDNLIAVSSLYGKTLKYFFGLKKNGRPYFSNNNEETAFEKSDSDKGGVEFNIFAIILNGKNDDKEYIITFGKEESNFELYDFENKDNQLYYQDGKEFFQTESNYFERGCIFQLKSENDYYIIGITASYNQASFFYLIKLLFNSKDIANNSPIVDIKRIQSERELMASCFESEKNYIICFYHSIKGYSIIVFDQNLNQLKNETIDNVSKVNNFFKCVHFKNETGAFLYNEKYITFALQFKEYKNGEIIDYFNSKSKIEIDINEFIDDVKLNDLIKIEDSKICFISESTSYDRMKIIILSNYVDEKIKIRYYLIKIKAYYLYSFSKQLMLSIYNDMIALAGISTFEGESMYGTITILSYPNSTDFIINLTDNNSTNHIIKFYENCKIENNLFGHIFKGIQIIDFSTGLKLIREDNKKEISLNDFISKNTNVELFLTKDILNLQKNARIKFAMVLTEPEYEKYNEYASSIDNDYCKENDEDNCEDEKQYFKKKSYIGRTSYCDIIFNSEDFINECNDHCIICSKNDNFECIICEYNYELSDIDKKKCIKQNEVEPVEITDSITESKKEELKSTNILSELTNTLLVKTNIPSDITNLSSDLTILSSETKIIQIDSKTSEIVGKSSEIEEKPTEIEEKPTEITTISPEIISTSILISNFSELSSDSFEKENKFSDQPTNSFVFMNNMTNKISEKLSEMDLSIILKENSINYFNCTKHQIIKEKILNKNYSYENIIIKEDHFIVQLSKYEDQYNMNIPDISSIDLGECENKLKRANNIPSSQPLIIFKTDINITEFFTTYVLFEVYNPLSLEKLNLSICINDEISISIPAELNSNIKTLYNSLNESGYNLFNGNDSFYYDICTTYTSLNETDILLSDRQKDIYTEGQSQLICQKGCKISSYDLKINKARCDCSVNIQEIKEINLQNLFEDNNIENTFYETLTHSNFFVVKCYKLIFIVSRIIKNIGEILMTIVFLIFIILIIIYCVKGNDYIIKNINFVLKLQMQNFKSFGENQILYVKRNSSKSKKTSKFKKINSMKKESINKKKLEKIFSQAPPKRLHIKKKICQTKITELSNNIINNNIVLNFKINTKDSANNIFTPKNKKFIKSNTINKSNENNLLSESPKKSLNNSYQLSFINKKKHNEINYKLLNDSELNSLKYKLAIKFDKRTYFQFYWSLTKQKQLILFTFCVSNDYNLFILKFCLLLISFSLYFSMNGFFFNDKTMHKIYKDNGKYNIIYKMPQLIYSVISSTLIRGILRALCLSEKNILELKKRNKGKAMDTIEKSKIVHSNLKIKFMIFFIFSTLLMGLFWYYISCFCAVFINTQIILIKDSIFSFILSNCYVFGLNFITGLFRIYSLRKGKNKKILYKISQLLSIL